MARYAPTYCTATFNIYFADVNGSYDESSPDTIIFTRAGQNNYTFLLDKAPSFDGYDADSSSGYNGSSHYELNYYYLRKSYSITFRDGVYRDGDNSMLQNKSSSMPLGLITNVIHGSDISGYNDYKPILPQGEEGFVFEGWYMDEACSKPYTFTTMPAGNLVVYAGWRQIQYRVFLHPQAGTDPSLFWGNTSQKMNFRKNYGVKVSAPTGQRDLYEFGGWYSDSTYQHRFFSEITTLNEQTVTTPYIKKDNPTDSMDRWGFIHNPVNGIAFNSDTIVVVNGDSISKNDRFWITKKLDLYAQWRHKLDGAEGVQVVYHCDECDSSSMPKTDTNLYLDKSKMVAKPAAASAVDNKIFAYWVLQNWSPVDGKFVDSLDANGNPVNVYPGGPYTLHLPYAYRKQVTEDSAVYIYQLRAELESFEDNHTFIVWYRNWKGAWNDTVRYDKPDSLTINMMKPIPSPDEVGEREGYIYKGWHRKGYGPEGSGQESTFEDKILGDTTTVNCLWYNPDDKQYYSKDYTTLDPDSFNFYRAAYGVAADEVTPYDYFYAVWEPIQYTIQFHKNTEDPIVTGTMEDQIFKYNETKELSKIGFLYKCHKFLGWATSENGDVVFFDQQEVSSLTSKKDSVIHLYAKWEEEDFHLVVSPDSATCLNPGSIDIQLNGVSMPNYTYSVIGLDTTVTPHAYTDTVWQETSSWTYIVAGQLVHGQYRVEVVTGSQCEIHKDTTVFLNPVEVTWDNPIETVCTGSPFVIKPSKNDDVRYLWETPTKRDGAVVFPDTANNNNPQEYILCTIDNSADSAVSYKIHAILGNCELGDVSMPIEVSSANHPPFSITLSSETDTLCAGTPVDVTATVNNNIYDSVSYTLRWKFNGTEYNTTVTDHSPTVTHTLTMPSDTCRGDFSVEVYYANVTECRVNAVKNFKVRIKDWDVAAPKNDTIHCVNDTVAPHNIPNLVPKRLDGCGNEMTPTLDNKLEELSDHACSGTVTYTYQYKDCDGHEKYWDYVYHIEKEAPAITITEVPAPEPVGACRYSIPEIRYTLDDCDPTQVTVAQTPSPDSRIQQPNGSDSVITITLTATDKCDNTTTPDITVTLPAHPTVTPMVEKNAFCLGDTIRVTAATTGTSNAAVITWTSTPSTGVFTYIEGEDTTFTATSHDPYTLTAVVKENECYASGETSVTVKAGAQLTVTNKNQTVCLGNEDGIANIYIMLQYTDSLNISGDLRDWMNIHKENTNIVISGKPDAIGTYELYLTTVSQNSDCGEAKDTVTIVVKELSDEDVTIDGDTVFCEGTASILSVDPDAKSYRWAKDDNTLYKNKYYLEVYETGTYTVTVTAQNGCISTGSKYVRMNPRPAVSIVLTDDTVCPNNNIQQISANITSPDKAPYTYSWTIADTIINPEEDASFNGTWYNAEPTITLPTTCTNASYYVTLHLTDSSGCTKTVTDTIVKMDEPPTITRKYESIILEPDEECKYYIPKGRDVLDTLVEVSDGCTPVEDLIISAYCPSANENGSITNTDSLIITVTDACGKSASTKIELRIPNDMAVHSKDSVVLNSFEWEGATYTESTTVENTSSDGSVCGITRVHFTVLHTNNLNTTICEGDTANIVVSVARPAQPAVGDVLCLKPKETANVYDTLVLRPDTFVTRATAENLKPIGVVFYVDPNDSRKGKALALVDAYSNYCKWSEKTNGSVHDGRTDNGNGNFLVAICDTNGLENTRNIITSADDNSNLAPAAYYCYHYNPLTQTPESGYLGGWYLPALGEQSICFAQRVIINKTFRQLSAFLPDGETIHAAVPFDGVSSDVGYWSSTDYSNDKAFDWNQKGEAKDHPKNRVPSGTLAVNYARAVFSFTLQQSARQDGSAMIGNIITFQDGSKGMICYVNPEKPYSGWAAALHDLGNEENDPNKGKYKMGTTMPNGLTTISVENGDTAYARYDKASWTYSGKDITAKLKTANSPAAVALDTNNVYKLSDGWYIPDMMQLRQWYSLFPLIRANLGDNNLPFWSDADKHYYWTSNKTDNNAFGCMLLKSGLMNSLSGNNSYHIRPVRDFDLSISWNDTSVVSEKRPMQPIVGDVLCLKGTAAPYDTLVLYPDTFVARANAGENLTPIGVVFYVDANDEWHGKALALVDAHLVNNVPDSCKWATNNNVSDQNDNNGFKNFLVSAKDTCGFTNTLKILESAKTKKAKAPAAEYCYTYNPLTQTTGNDTLGWYLPAAGELSLWYAQRVIINQTLKNIQDNWNNRPDQFQVTLPFENLATDSAYWSSTDYNNTDAINLNQKGEFRNHNKNDGVAGKKPKFVRAVFSFTLQKDAQQDTQQDTIGMIGNVITFPDGSKGVICYVNPEDPYSGWAAALHDLGNSDNLAEKGAYKMGTTMPSGLTTISVANGNPDYARYDKASWTYLGKENMEKVSAVNTSNEVAAAVMASDTADYKFDDGWYIPDMMQLRQWYALFPIIQGIQENKLPNWNAQYYWASTKTGSTHFGRMNLTTGLMESRSQGESYHIRPVRDFNLRASEDEIPVAYSDPLSDTMQVSPDSTSTYTATIEYCGWTLPVTATVIVATQPVITAKPGTVNSDLGCNPATIPAITVNNFTVSDNTNATATVTLTKDTVVNGCEHSRTWTASYQNQCEQAAVPVQVTYQWAELSVKAKDSSKVFDGEALQASYSYTPNDITPTPTVRYKVKEGDMWSNYMTTEPSITNVDTLTYLVEVTSESCSCTVSDTATLIITPKAVTVTAQDKEFTYTGAAQSWPEYDVDGLVGDDAITAVVTGSITFPSESPVPNVVGDHTFTTGSADNYSVTKVNGELTMTNASEAITITAASQAWTYDGATHSNNTVTVTEGTLFEGDMLVATATGSTTNVADTEEGNNPIMEGYKIMHGTEDVTANYVITPVAGTLTINPKAVTVTAQDKAFAYTGAEQSWPKYDVDGLIGNDAISAVVTGSITFPSESPVTNELTSYEFTTGTPGNYNVTKADGELTMSNASVLITITAASQSWTYDGTPHQNTTVTVTNGELLTGDELVATANGSVTNVADVATGNNPIAAGYKIIHGEEDVTANYVITPVAGTLIINPKEVTVSVEDKTVEYNGNEQSGNTEYTFSNVVEGQTATITYIPAKGTLVNTYENGTYTASSFKVEDASNNNMTANYTLGTQTPGKLTINNRTEKYEITVVAKSSTGNVYDGTEKSATGFETLTFTVDNNTYTVEGLTTSDPSSTNVCELTNAISGTAVVKDAKNNDVTAQFNIHTTDGTLKITAREVTVSVADKTVEYNGSEQYGNTEYTFANVVSGQTATITYTPAKGTLVNTYDDGAYTASSFKVEDGEGTDVTTNYTLGTQTPGKLTITDRTEPYEITVVANSNTGNVYDGTAKSATGFETLEFTVDGNTYTVEGLTTSNPSSTDVINIANAISGTAVVKDAAGNDVTTQFNIHTTNGTLEITAREVTVSVTDKTVEYNGSEQYGESAYAFANVVEGQTATITYTPAKGTLVNTYDNGSYGTDFKVVDGNNNDVTTNYTLGTQTPGKLTITDRTDKYEITVVANSSTGNVYDGTAKSATGFETLIFTVDNNTYTVEGLTTSNPSSTDVINIANAISGTAVVKDAAGNNVTNQFDVHTTDGTLEILAREVTVSVADKTVEYNGSEQYGNTAYSFSNVVSGHTATITYTPSHGTLVSTTAYNNGSYGADFKVMNGSTDVTANYTLGTQTKGKLTITDRTEPYAITVKANSNTGNVYDGTEKSATGFETLEFTVEGNTYTVSGLTTSDPISTNVTNTANAISGTAVVKDANNNDVTNQFSVATQNGTLEITAREITVSVADKTVEYNGSEQYGNTEYTFANVVSGQTATITYTAAKGTLVNTYDNGSYDSSSFKVEDASNNDMTSNYTLGTQTKGKLIITDRTNKYEITVVANSNTGNVYDGTAKSATGFETLEFTVEGNTYTVSGLETSDPSSVDVCELTNAISGTAVVKDAAGNDVTNQFVVNTTNGTLKITPKAVTVTAASKEFTYDGTAHSNASYEVDGLVGNDVLTAVVTGSITFPSESPVMNVLSSYEFTTGTTSNYNVTTANGSLVMTNASVAITITAASDEWTYDGDAHYNNAVTVTSGSLLTGDELVASATGSVTNVEDTGDGNNPIAEGYKVMHGNEDVTANYTITPVAGKLTINPKAVTVTAQDKTFAYTGEAKQWPYYDVEGLVGDDAITAVVDGSITYTSESPVTNELTSYSFTAGTPGNYSVTTANGQLTMTNAQQEITITAASQEWTYDGTAHQNTTVSVTSGELLTDNELVATATGSVTNVADNTNNPIASGYKIMHGDEDVTANYAITTVAGTLKINPKTVTVTAKSEEFTYDGTAHSNSGYDTVGLVGNDKISAMVTGSIMFPSESPVTNELTSYEFTSGTASNYTVTTANGLLSMTNASVAITITAASDEWTYDGNAQTNTAVTVTSGSLLTGDVLVATATGSVTEVADTGEGNNPIAAGYKIMHGTEDVTANYVITPEAGTLTINPKPVTVTAKSQEFTYDGTSHSNSGYIVNGLVGNDAISATVTGSIMFPSESPVTNELTSYEFTAGTPGNYTVTTTNGQLTMKKASVAITITAANGEWTYDGNAHSNSAVTVTSGTLLTGDELVANATGSVTEVADTGEGNNPIASGYKIMHGDEDVTENYAITPAAGTLTITARTVTVSVADSTTEYNGSEQQGHSEYTFSNVVEGQTATISYTPAKGTLENTYDNGTYIASSFKVEDGEGTNVTSNYTLGTQTPGKLTISDRTNKYEITVVANSNTGNVYDGTAKSATGFETLSFTVEENTYTVEGLTTSNPSSTNVCNLTNAISGTAVVKDAAGNDVTNQFTVHTTNGTLEITAREVTVSVENKTVEYNGSEQYGNTEYTFSNVVSGQTATITYTPAKGTLVDTYDNGTYTGNTFKVMNGSTDVTANYTLGTQTPGKLTITDRTNKYEITVVANSNTGNVYDGTTKSATGFETLEFTVDGNTYTVSGLETSDPSSTNICNLTNAISGTAVVKDTAGNNVTAQFDVHTTDGTLEITTREVTVSVADKTVEYNGSEQYGESAYTFANVVSGHAATITYTPSHGTLASSTAYNNGSYGTDFNVVDGEGADVTTNYTLGTQTPGKLTITDRTEPYAITVKAKSDTDNVYDGQPHSAMGFETLEFTVEDNTYTVEGLTTSDPSNTDVTNTANAISGTAVVRDANNNDVTTQFDVHTTDGTLEILAREVTVSVANDTTEYNGSEQYGNTTYSFNNVLSGQTATITYTPSHGTLVNTFDNGAYTANSFKVEDGDGTDVTSNYTLGTQTPGKLTIKNRTNKYEITVVANSDTGNVYDGTAKSATGFETLSFTVDGHNYTVEGLTTSDPSSANVCELTNAISGTALVKDAAGNDVTNQFVVSTTDGSLIITQKPVKVTARSKAFAYTGTAQSWPEYEVNGLVGNDALTAVVTGSITFPSQSPVTNELTSYQFTSGTPGNYTVTTANGQLTMTHASVPITITAASQSWTYDGNAHTNSTVTVTSGNLLTGDSLVATATGSVTNVAQTANPIAAGYKVMHGEEDVTTNYVITPKAGTLAITARVVTVSVADKEVEYNGSIQGGNTAYTFDNVVESQTATITYAPSHGTLVNTYDNGNYTSNSFKVVDTSNNDVTANYTLGTQTAGKLTINDRTDKYEITVVANSNTGNIYDGTTKSATGFVTLNFNVAGHNYTVSGLTTSDPSSANVCELTNAISGTAVVKDVAGNDVTSQFVVNTTNGVLTITPRTVTVSVADKIVHYNGGLQYGNTACLFNNVVSGQTATIGYTPASGILVSATTYNNGSYDNNFKVMSGNTDVTSNYILSEKVKGNLTINNRTNKYTINVMAKSSTDNVYDGTEKSVSGFETLEFHIGGNIFTVSGLTTSDPSSTNVCDLTNTVSGTAVVTDAQGNDVTAQFNVVKWNGALKVLKRPITVSVDNRVVDYNGNMQYGNNECTFSNVVSGQTATISYTTSSGITASETPYNNGSYSNDFKVMSDETDVTSNYTLTLQIKGTLKINLPPLTVKADTLSMEYDGTPLEATWSYSPFSANPTFLYKTKHSDGQWDDEYTSTIPNITDAGTLTYLVRATANNYSVEDTATLTVTPVAITIKANSATKVYGDSDPTLTAEVIDMPANGVEPVYQLSRATGEDVGNYAITVTAEAASNSNYIVSVVGNNFTITQRPVTVSVADAPDVEYDGDEHTGITTYTFDDVLTGHSATITYTPAKGTLVGSYTGSYGDDFKVMSGSTDVTANYHLTTRTPGTLKVIDRETPYEITVVAMSDTTGNVYTGQPHHVSGFNTLEFTVNGHLYVVEGLSASVSATNAGTYTNAITGTAVVKDVHGHDVTSQFTVNKTDGVLRIDPRPVTLISASGEMMYNGDTLTRNEQSHIAVSGDDFVSGEGATYHITGMQVFVGQSPNTFTYTLNPNTLAGNYDITTQFGTLTVTHDTFAFTVASLSSEWYFDGESHTREEYVVIYNSIPLDTVPGTNGLSFIFPTDTLTITPNFGGITHVDQNTEHNNRFTYTLLHNDQYAGKRDTLYGTLKILPVLASVHIKGNKGSATYNGDPHTVTGYIVQGIDEEHDLYQLSYFECLGDTIATRTETGVTPMNLDASDFRNLNTDFNPVHFYVTDGEMEVSPVGTVTVLIDGEDNITHYDGNEHSVHGYTVTSISDSLYTTDDFTFTGTAVAARTDVGTSYMGLADTMFHNTNPNFQNVIFRVEDGYQSIERIHVTVKIKGNYGANEYDGNFHSASGYNLTISNSLYQASYVSFNGTASVSRKDKGTTYMELDTTQFVNQNANFHVTFEVVEDGFQTIYPNTTSLTLTCPAGDTIAKMYDGTPLTATAVATSTVSGDEFLIEYSTDGNVWTTTRPSITNYGVLPVEVRCSNSNYQTQTCPYSLSIHKREVTLTSADSTRMYNGDTLRNNLVLVGGDGFVNGEGATYQVTGSQLLPGTSHNTFTYALKSNTSAANYHITTNEGTLTVTNRPAGYRYPITVTSNSNPTATGTPIVYDGLKHTASDFVTMSFTTSDGHTYTVEGLEAHVSAFDAGEYDNTIVGTPVVLDEHGNDVTAQFDIQYEIGKLVITKRPITITVPNEHATMMYNGDSLRVSFENIHIENLAARDTLTSGYIISEGYTVGTYTCAENNFMAGPEGVATKHSFDITHAASSEYSAGSSLSNYIPKFLVKLYITDRPLELTASSAEKVYDGTTLTMTETDFTVTNGTSIPTTDTVIITRSGAQTCVGETAHEINSVQVIHKADNVDVTSNYAISTVDGLLKVTPATTGLSCPPTLKITLKEGSGDTLVPASQLGTATHDLVDAGVATVSNDLSNNPLSVGTYNVTWTLYDACDSAMTTCEQTVVVDYAPCNGVTYKGHPYGAKRIGHQCWLTENLRNTKDAAGNTIADFHSYKEDMVNRDKFGYLYSWYSAVGVTEGDNDTVPTTHIADDGTEYVQGICPTGWAVPSQHDVTVLNTTVGSVDNLKDPSTAYWLPGYEGFNPGTGFNARGGGRYNAALNRYEGLLTAYHFWEADQTIGNIDIMSACIAYYCDSISIVEPNQKNDRKSVRCIRKVAP